MNDRRTAQFSDAIELWERAAAAPHGIQIECPTEGLAINTLQRLNRTRKYDRELNARSYPPDHPLHRCSSWDSLAISRRGNIVLIRPSIMKITKITELPPNMPNTDPYDTVQPTSDDDSA